jgi:AcrR family transcriptional regulator
MAREKSQTEFVDPRIRRSKQMLREALAKLLSERDFNAISVQDITERATVNRATFYDHYPDKAALVQDMVGEQFDQILASRGLRFDAQCDDALRAIVSAVCDFLLSIPTGCPEAHRNLETLLQTTVIDRMRSLFEAGLKAHSVSRDVDVAFLANIVSWAIYGAVTDWVHDGEKRAPRDEFIEVVRTLVEKILHATSDGELK